MYKLLIVDDEYLVRKGLSETIDWESFGITVVGTAADGAEALKIIEEKMPDVIITDMRMAELDGVGLIREITARGYDCAVVVLSGYKDFAYLKATLENGIHAYLLKPTHNDELVKTVLAEIENLNKARESKRYYTQLESELPTIHNKLVYDVIKGNFADEHTLAEKLRICRLHIPENGVLLYVTANGVEERETEGLQSLYAYLGASKWGNIDVSIVEKYEKCIVALTKETDVSSICGKCRTLISAFEKENTEVVAIAVSDPYEGLADIQNAYREAKQMVKNRLLRVVNCVLTTSDNTGNIHAVVKSAVDYICSHYAEDITIKSCAAALFVSDSHLMHLFKKNLGKTFNEYLTEYRILQAKKLLRLEKMRIYEVAVAVGYSDVKYFGQVFRKYVGCMPSEYAGGEEQ